MFAQLSLSELKMTDNWWQNKQALSCFNSSVKHVIRTDVQPPAGVNDSTREPTLQKKKLNLKSFEGFVFNLHIQPQNFQSFI